jgi:5'(3')-deoxyribonucleotidase
MKLFLDIDGVLSDFVWAICTAHNRPRPYIDDQNLGVYDLEKIWGMSQEEFWGPTNNKFFWRDMPLMHDALAILTMCESYISAQNICLLSSPTIHSASLAGKQEWIFHHFPQYAKKYLLGSGKYFCANEQTVLVDDRDVNLSMFRLHGGKGVIVPRPWNSFYNRDVLMTLEAQLKTIL